MKSLCSSNYSTTDSLYNHLFYYPLIQTTTYCVSHRRSSGCSTTRDSTSTSPQVSCLHKNPSPQLMTTGLIHCYSGRGTMCTCQANKIWTIHQYFFLCLAMKYIAPRGITLNNQYTMLKLFLFFIPYKGKV